MNNNQCLDEIAITNQIIAGKLLIINPRRKNGLFLIKKYYAEFAGPGSAVGSCFDNDLKTVIPVGTLSLIEPRTPKEKKQGYLIRRQWARLIEHITSNPIAEERAQVILNQFKYWFDDQTTLNLPDEAFALLVGVFPSTVKKARDLVDLL